MTPPAFRVLKAVCGALDVDHECALSRSRVPMVIQARDTAMYVVRIYQFPRVTIARLGKEFERDPSIVISALARAESRKCDPRIMTAIEAGRIALSEDSIRLLLEIDRVRDKLLRLESAVRLLGTPVVGKEKAA